MYVIRRVDNDHYPYYAGKTDHIMTTVYSWASVTDKAKQYRLAVAISLAALLAQEVGYKLVVERVNQNEAA
jgi:hypothetical protein